MVCTGNALTDVVDGLFHSCGQTINQTKKHMNCLQLIVDGEHFTLKLWEKRKRVEIKKDCIIGQDHQNMHKEKSCSRDRGICAEGSKGKQACT